MASFKLEKGGSAREQARTGGAFLLIIGLITAYLIMLEVGLVMALLGLVLVIGSFAATE